MDHATHSLTSIKEPKNKDLDIITKCSRLRTDGWFEEEGIKPLRRCWRYLPELSFVAFLLQVLIFLSQAHLWRSQGVKSNMSTLRRFRQVHIKGLSHYAMHLAISSNSPTRPWVRSLFLTRWTISLLSLFVVFSTACCSGCVESSEV